MFQHELAILLFVAFITKHFVVDFLFQGPYQYLNKGTYAHPGGILHAGLHTVSTFVLLAVLARDLPLQYVAMLAVFEGVVHYHIDWAKMNLNRILNLKPDNSEKFWYMMGFDQYLHYLTYVALVWYAIA